MRLAVLFLPLLLHSKPPLAEPCVAPDRAEVAFVSGGDIWTAPLNGGEARLLVSHPATESRPIFSPDGRRLAFMSSRTGNGDVYVLELASGELKRLTFTRAWSVPTTGRATASGCTSLRTLADIAGMSDMFRVAAEGGTPHGRQRGPVCERVLRRAVARRKACSR